MQNMHNIEKSGFHAGEYVGYSKGRVFRIRKTNSSFGNWIATQQNANNAQTIYAMRLSDMSKKLDELA